MGLTRNGRNAAVAALTLVAIALGTPAAARAASMSTSIWYRMGTSRSHCRSSPRSNGLAKARQSVRKTVKPETPTTTAMVRFMLGIGALRCDRWALGHRRGVSSLVAARLRIPLGFGTVTTALTIA